MIYQHGNGFRIRLVFRTQHANQEKMDLSIRLQKWWQKRVCISNEARSGNKGIPDPPTVYSR